MEQARDTERIREAVNTAKESVTDVAGEVSARVSRAADWREQVRSHPAASLAVAAVAGLLIGRQLAVMMGAGGLAAMWAGAALRAAPARVRGNLFADRILSGLGSPMASALVVPVISGIQSFIESGRTLSRRRLTR